MDTEEARASYDEGAYYYYTEDHIGRPVNLREQDRDLAWWEQHEPFGDLIAQDTPQGELMAGTDPYDISWTPPFRFPGQYQEEDMYPFTQNHYREYMGEVGRFNRKDPSSKRRNNLKPYISYSNNPILRVDYCGLEDQETPKPKFHQCDTAKEAMLSAAVQKVITALESKPCCLNEAFGRPKDNTGFAILMLRVAKAGNYYCTNTAIIYDNNFDPLDPDNACATGDIRGNRSDYSNCALAGTCQYGDSKIVCGCLECTVLHELFHNFGYDDSDEDRFDQACTDCLGCK